MDHLSGMDASFLHLETPETPMHVGSLMLFELPEGYTGDYYEDVKALIGQAHAPVRRSSTASWRRCRSSWPSRCGSRTTTSTSTTTCAVSRCAGPARWRSWRCWSHACTRPARPQPPAVGDLCHRRAGGRPASPTTPRRTTAASTARPGSRWPRCSTTSPTVREVPPPRRARAGQQRLPARCHRAAAGGAVEQRRKQYLKLGKLLPTAVKALGAAGKIDCEQAQAVSRASARSTSVWRRRRSSTNRDHQPALVQHLSLPLADIKALGKRVGGTVNTVVMAMCSGALRRFLKDRDLLPKKSLIAMVPVSLRSSRRRAHEQPGVGDPRRPGHRAGRPAGALQGDPRLVRGGQGGGEASSSRCSGVDVPITGAPWLMTGMASLLGRSGPGSRMPAAANVAISNVPGPRCRCTWPVRAC
jgi:diacylglycerol O-acyltransferase